MSSRQPNLSGRRASLKYYSSPKPAPIPTKSKSKRPVFKRLFDVMIVLAILAAIVYSLWLQPTATVKTTGPTYRPIATYNQAVDQQLKKIKYRNKVTFDEGGLLKDLQSQHPEIGALDAHLPLWSQKPQVNLYFSAPAFSLESQGREYLLDANGTVIGDKSQLHTAQTLPVVRDQSGYPVEPGKTALNAVSVLFINQLLQQMNKAGLVVNSLVLPDKPQELDVTTKDHNFFTKYYLGGDVATQAGQYLAARHNFLQTKKFPRAYLDVRVPGKIFYK